MIKYRKLMNYINEIGGYFSIDTVKSDEQTSLKDLKILNGSLPKGEWQIILIAHPIENGLLKIHPDEEILGPEE